MLQNHRVLPPGELLNECQERIGYAIEESERGPAVLPKIRNKREERLKKRRIRDRTRCAAQTAKKREADLQQRRCRLAGETDKVRQARLQQMTDLPMRLLRREKPGCCFQPCEIGC